MRRAGQLLIERHNRHLHGAAQPHRLQPLGHEWVGIPGVGNDLINTAHGAQRQADQGIGDLEGGSGREGLLRPALVVAAQLTAALVQQHKSSLHARVQR
jgi:hypothetical protein